MGKKNLIKLTDAAFYILSALGKPLHGYAIMKRVEEISSEGGMPEFKLGPATLYTNLTKLVEQKLIQQLEDVEQSDERRKPYVLTELGWEVLADEVKRRAEMVRVGQAALDERG